MTSLISIWRCSPISFLFVYLPLSFGMVDHDVIPVNTELEERFWRRSSLEPIRAMAVRARRSQETDKEVKRKQKQQNPKVQMKQKRPKPRIKQKKQPKLVP